jgi:flagellar biogenesis protein FliO
LTSSFQPVWEIIKVFASLAVVLCIGYYGIRFLGQHRGVKKGFGRSIEVLESIPIGQRRILVLVAVRGRELLLGVSESGVSLLASWEAARTEELKEV